MTEGPEWQLGWFSMGTVMAFNINEAQGEEVM